MRYDILTIFPEFFESPLSVGNIKKARDKNILEIKTHDLRDYTKDKHRSVDDTPYGGGGGMLMKPEPIGAAIEDVKLKNVKSLVVLTTPAGEKFTDSIARELAGYEQLIVICGRYEGVDERVKDLYVDKEISLGDFVLTGGEYAACVIVDCVSRFVPGVLGNEQSPENESFKESLLEYPQYTRPESFKDERTPEVLLSGNHKDIEAWRREQSVKRTFLKRPDLLDKAKLSREELEKINELKKSNMPTLSVYIALIHYPVYNNRLNIITTAFTNLDVHDIARAGATYGINRFFLVQPNLEQQTLIGRVLKHWTDGRGASFNESRSRALGLVEVKNTLGETVEEIEKAHGKKPRVVVTDARYCEDMIGFEELRDMIFDEEDQPYLLVFGTGWGLAKEIMESADFRLKPLSGYTDYNHLSVRSATAIILDRLLSCTI